MAKKTKEYKRLPGRSRGLTGISTLWRAEDHLLAIYGRGFSEDYKRYYYKDIQAILVRETWVGMAANIIMVLLIGLFVLIGWRGDEELMVIMGIFAAPIFLILLLNIFRGKTVVCHIQTAVQTEKLPSLKHRRTVRKALKQIRPLIEQAQGALPAGALERYEAAHPSPKKARAGKGLNPDDPNFSSTKKHESGRYHIILFILLLMDGIITLLYFSMNHVALVISGTVFGMFSGIFVIVALVRQYESDMERSLQGVVWGSLVLVGFNFLVGMIISMTTTIGNPVAAQNYLELIKLLANKSPYDNPWLFWSYIFLVVGEIGLGISGLLLLRWRGPVVVQTARPGVVS